MWKAYSHTFPGLLVLCLLLCGPGGCASDPSTPTQRPDAAAAASPESESISVAAGDYQAAFNTATAVLRERGYELDRQDFRFGVITTQPKPSPTLFEFWIPDNHTPQQAVASTMNHERRVARVTIRPIEATSDAGAHPMYELRVGVTVQRRALPVRRVIGSSYHRGTVFNRLREVPAELLNRGLSGPQYWARAGGDPHTTTQLLDAIRQRMQQSAAASDHDGQPDPA